MTLSKLLRMVDDIRPNQYSDETKVTWLNEVESKAIEEVFNRAVGDMEIVYEPYDNLNDQDTVLLIPEQFNDVYVSYICSKIDYFNAEFDRYNNDVALFASAWEDFGGYYRRTHAPLERRRNEVHREEDF